MSCKNSRLIYASCVGVEYQIGFHNVRESPIRLSFKTKFKFTTVKKHCKSAETIKGFI